MSESGDERQVWLAYIGKLNDRALNRQRASGFTAWALAVALVGLFLKILPVIPELITTPAARSSHLLTASVFCSAAFFLLIFLATLTHGTRTERARLQSRLDRASAPVVYLSLGALTAVTTFLSYFSAQVASSHALSRWPFWVFTFFFGIMTIPLHVAFSRDGAKRTGRVSTPMRLQSPAFFAPEQRKRQDRIMYAIFFAGVCITLVPVSESIPRITTAAHVEVVKWAASVCGFLYLSLFMIFRLSGLASDRFLSELERDIVVESLPPEEIRRRYIQELRGEDVTSWLQAEDQILAKARGVLENTLDSASKELERISGIDSSLRYEINGRCDQVRTCIDAAFEVCRSKYGKLLTQLRAMRNQSRPPLSSSAKHALDPHIAEYGSQLNDMQKRCDAILKACDERKTSGRTNESNATSG